MIGVSLVSEGHWFTIERRLASWALHIAIIFGTLNGISYVSVRLKMLEYVLRVQMLSSSFVVGVCVEELDNHDRLLNVI